MVDYFYFPIAARHKLFCSLPRSFHLQWQDGTRIFWMILRQNGYLLVVVVSGSYLQKPLKYSSILLMVCVCVRVCVSFRFRFINISNTFVWSCETEPSGKHYDRWLWVCGKNAAFSETASMPIYFHVTMGTTAPPDTACVCVCKWELLEQFPLLPNRLSTLCYLCYMN